MRRSLISVALLLFSGHLLAQDPTAGDGVPRAKPDATIVHGSRRSRKSLRSRSKARRADKMKKKTAAVSAAPAPAPKDSAPPVPPEPAPAPAVPVTPVQPFNP